MAIPDTQTEAWDEIQKHLPEKRRVIYSVIDSYPTGRTAQEVKDELGWEINCVGSRITELHQSAHVVDSGERRVNPKTGKRNIVWMTRRHWDRRHREPLFHRSGQGELF